MRYVIRENTFETNSSSSHAISVISAEIFQEFENGEIAFRLNDETNQVDIIDIVKEQAEVQEEKNRLEEWKKKPESYYYDIDDFDIESHVNLMSIDNVLLQSGKSRIYFDEPMMDLYYGDDPHKTQRYVLEYSTGDFYVLFQKTENEEVIVELFDE